MNNGRSEVWPTLGYAALMWVAVIGVLVYNHHLLITRQVPVAIRTQKELPLWIVAACFLVFNGVMTALRLKQIDRMRRVLDSKRAAQASGSVIQQLNSSEEFL